MSYAAKLKQAMDGRNMSRKELCAGAQISASQLSMYLGGHSEPRPDAAARICAALGLPPEAFGDPAKPVRDVTDRNVPVTEAARMLGVSPDVVRAALQAGVVDFGFAVQVTGEKYTYHISPKKLYEYIGAPVAG